MKLALLVSALIPAALAGQRLCEQEKAVSHDGYTIQNNLYGEDHGKGHQCTHVEHISGKGVKWSTGWKWSGNEYLVKSYSYSAKDVNNKQLVSGIHSMPTSAKWSYENAHNIVADVSYDLFTAKDKNHDPSSGDFELMIWLGRYGDPSKIAPIGKKHGTAQVGGHKWELWIGVGTGTSMTTYSFVAPSKREHWSGDVKQFFDHLAQHHKFPAHEQHLLTFQFGTEPKTGGEATLKVEDWMAEIH